MALRKLKSGLNFLDITLCNGPAELYTAGEEIAQGEPSSKIVQRSLILGGARQFRRSQAIPPYQV
jgi:hypothetical protein